MAKLTPATWDRNQDGEISEEEIQTILAIAWGIQTPAGDFLRWSTGEVLNWSYFRGMDRDGNGELLRGEFEKSYRNPPEQIERAWSQLDRDQDGHVTVAEASQNPSMFRTDLLRMFLEFDQDRDGQVSHEELLGKSSSWQTPLAPFLSRAFDEDGDGRLSLREFRQTPIANSMANWSTVRQDRDFDGRLSFDEFYVETTPQLLELNRHVFDRLDVNDNNSLEPNELFFSIAYEKLPADHLLRIWDVDADGQVAIEELNLRFSGADLGTCRKLFIQWDRDEDDRLTLVEIRQKGAGAAPSLKRDYKLLDQNLDGQLSLPELLASIPAAQHSQWTQYFRVLDFNRDQSLSLEEYGYLPGRRALANRLATVPDPVVERMDAQREQILQQLASVPRNEQGRWRVADWPASQLSSVSPTLSALAASVWDRDQDGAISEAEIQALLAIAWGLQTPNGDPLRWDTGEVLNWSYFRGMDREGDGDLSRSEFEKSYRTTPERLQSTWTMLDQNQDGRVTVAEASQSGSMFRTDLLRMFLEFDLDLDGYVSQEELLKKSTSWQVPLAPYLVAAFDQDHDGRLSLHEFRMTPIANAMSHWFIVRQDRDHDGRLSWPEFIVEPGELLIELNCLVFDHLDLNDDGLLAQSEYQFSISPSKVPAEVVFATWDRAGTGHISLADYLTSQPVAKIAEARRQFIYWDRDEDGRLTLDEYRLRNEPVARTTPRDFRSLDTDNDGLLSPDELLATVNATQQAALARTARVVDFDHDGHLSLAEFSSIPGRAILPQDRGPVPDPIQERFETQLAGILTLTNNQEISRRSWLGRQLKSLSPTLSQISPADWDRNANGSISSEEIRQILAIAWGISTIDGTPLRTDSGEVLNSSYFRGMDRNQDGALTINEYSHFSKASPAEITQRFRELDLDADGRVTMNEALTSPLAFFRNDPLKMFLTFDVDLDGLISEQELIQKSYSWQVPLAPFLARAFDEDHDQRLSFREFRLTPLANPMGSWSAPRKDQNHDGKLSWDEFFTDVSPQLTELSRFTFERLDRNHDLALTFDEFQFSVDLTKINLEVAFQMQDKNYDGKLTIDEVFAETKPPASDQRATERYHLRLARAEDRFLADDRNGDRSLDLEEFQQSRDAVLAVAERRSRALSRQSAPSEKNWLLTGFLIIDALVILGVAGFFLRRKFSS